jgi:hypothetical protein
MRRRITLLFVLLFLLVAVIGYGLRSWTVERDVRAHDDALLHREVSVLATAVDERMGSGASVDAAFLRAFAARDVGIRFHPADGPDIEIHGPGFTGSLEPDDGNTNVWATAPTTGDGFVLLSEDDSAVRTAVYPGLPCCSRSRSPGSAAICSRARWSGRSASSRSRPRSSGAAASSSTCRRPASRRRGRSGRRCTRAPGSCGTGSPPRTSSPSAPRMPCALR